MVNGKAKKKVVKKKPKFTEEEQGELKAEGELPEKSVRESENRQLIWFVVVVGIVFAVFLISYFGVEGARTFEYIGVDWVIEEYDAPTGTIYHGRFEALSNPDLMFNVFLRNDPRENDVATEGTFNKFKRGGIISISPEADECRGALSGAMIDLGGFLAQGVGVGTIDAGSTDSVVAVESGMRHAVCNKVNDRTLVVVDVGEPRVVQDEKYLYCYTIYIDDCADVSPVEKFIIKSIEDFGGAE